MCIEDNDMQNANAVNFTSNKIQSQISGMQNCHQSVCFFSFSFIIVTHSLLSRFNKTNESIIVSFIPWDQARMFIQSLMADLTLDSQEYVDQIIRITCHVFLNTVDLMIKTSSKQVIPVFVSSSRPSFSSF